MSIEEVLLQFIQQKILVYSDGQYVLEQKYVPKTKETLKIENLENLLKAYQELWPKGVKTGNRLVRRSVNSLRGKMIAFRNKRRDITEQQIIEAATYYVKECKKRDYDYMISGDYFLIKNGSSELEAIIDSIAEGDIKTTGADNFVESLN